MARRCDSPSGEVRLPQRGARRTFNIASKRRPLPFPSSCIGGAGATLWWRQNTCSAASDRFCCSLENESRGRNTLHRAHAIR